MRDTVDGTRPYQIVLQQRLAVRSAGLFGGQGEVDFGLTQGLEQLGRGAAFQRNAHTRPGLVEALENWRNKNADDVGRYAECDLTFIGGRAHGTPDLVIVSDQTMGVHD